MNQFDPIKQLRAAERRAARPPEQRKRARITEAFFGRFAGLPLRERQARSLAYALLHTPVRTPGGPRAAALIWPDSFTPNTAVTSAAAISIRAGGISTAITSPNNAPGTKFRAWPN